MNSDKIINLDEMDILFEVVAILDKINIPYMLTGSMALSFYTDPRMTRDIDLVIQLKLDEIEQILENFKDAFYVTQTAVKEAIEFESSFNLIHNVTLIKVDCIIRKRLDYRILEFRRRCKMVLEGKNVFVVSKEDLILSKLIWAKESESEQQMRDIKSLLRSGYDFEYVAEWAEKLAVQENFKKVLYE